MTVVAFTPGYAFTIMAGSSTPVDVTAQITDAGIDVSTNASTIYTLGGSLATAANKAVVVSQVEDTQTISFLFDGDSGFYSALDVAIHSGAQFDVETIGAEATWTCSGVVTALSAATAAGDDAMTCTASFLFSSATFAATTP